MNIFFLIVMMEWRHKKYPSALAVFLACILELRYLEDYRQIFDQETPRTTMGIKSSFRTAKANTAMIPPSVKLPVSPIKTWAGYALYHKETETGTDKSRTKNYQLTEVGDVHDVEVTTKVDTTGEVGKNCQR